MATEQRPITDLVQLDALALSEAIHTRQVSCVEVMQAHLKQIERYNSSVNAIVTLRGRDELLAEARERDAQLAAGDSLGWMHGFPHAVKDLAATRGIRTTQGSPQFADSVPTQDAYFVERLRGAGAILIGKTNTPEFGLGSQTYNQVFGPTGNAYDPSKTAGGSSGGAAAALALRMLPVADGSDMGGSLRNPAAWHNLFGLRPSAGRVPRGPAVEGFMQQLSVDGGMARTVPELARLLSVMAGYDARSPLTLDDDPGAFAAPLDTDVRGWRIGWLGDLDGYLPTEPGVMDLCASAARVFEGLGCVVEDTALNYSPEALWQTWVTLRWFLQSGSLADLYRDPAKRAQLKPEAQWEVEGGLRLSGADVYQASAARTAWFQAALELFERFDALLLPSAQVFPFDVRTHWPRDIAGRQMDTYHRWMEVMVPATLAGLPAISVPAGFNADGLPMGLQVIGRPRGDLALLQLAYAFEQATDWTSHRPPLLDGAQVPPVPRMV